MEKTGKIPVTLYPPGGPGNKLRQAQNNYFKTLIETNVDAYHDEDLHKTKKREFVIIQVLNKIALSKWVGSLEDGHAELMTEDEASEAVMQRLRDAKKQQKHKHKQADDDKKPPAREDYGQKEEDRTSTTPSVSAPPPQKKVRRDDAAGLPVSDLQGEKDAGADSSHGQEDLQTEMIISLKAENQCLQSTCNLLQAKINIYEADIEEKETEIGQLRNQIEQLRNQQSSGS